MNKLHHTAAGLFFVFSSALAITGCMANSTESGDAPEVTGEAQGAYGETTCGTTSSGVVDDYTGYFDACPPGTQWYTSSSTYGSSACSSAYIVQFHNIGQGWGDAAWAGPTLNSTTCPTAHVNLKSYDDAGTVIDVRNTTGVWNSSTSQCNFLGGGNPPVVSLSTSSGSSSKRVIAQAYTSVEVILGFPTVTFYPVSINAASTCIR